ncbi:hypothetical protein DIC66_15005 [Rhodoferax lacus]|uniref:Uncharacterized protein n=1 Tax=Rhodoferax lacus TaxID=2184758 RepID=A0A3E1R9L1_9BURK|nr:hypothetical protein [Rhodoferax lacus]RFO96027.1 hypothetical protein DIC66_15005 [Rhodoferax lacus]
MYRVVTKSMVTQNGIRKRQIDPGPWQESEQLVRSWAQFLEATGRYDVVTVESNGRSSDGARSDTDIPDEDLFMELGN